MRTKKFLSVVENGGQLVGGYSEKELTAYTLTAAVDQNTNGLKYATKNGDGYTFSAAHAGTGSGVAESTSISSMTAPAT